MFNLTIWNEDTLFYKRCGELRHSQWANKSPIAPGTPFPSMAVVFKQDNEMSLGGVKLQGKIIWNGFAREETLKEKFLSTGWKRGEIIAESYIEKGNEYSIPLGNSIQVVVLSRNDIHFVNIITREAKGKEVNIHNRWPVITTRRFIPK